MRFTTWRYALALSLVAALSLGSFVSLRRVIASQEKQASIMNMSGRQRMLSQRIGLLAAQLAQTPDDARLRGEISLAVTLMQESQATLTAGELSPELRGLYFTGPDALDARVAAFTETANQALAKPQGPATHKLIELATSGLLGDLDAAVAAFQRDSEAKIARLHRVHLGLLCLTLALLACEALFVFRPMATLLLAMIERLLEASQKRAEQEARLHAALRVEATARMAALGEVAAGVAHEINNPVQIIQGSVAQLERGFVEPAKLRSVLLVIDRTAARIAHIVRSLLTFARDGSHDPFLPASVQEIVAEALELCQARFNTHGVELRVPTLDPDLFFDCRRAQVTQALVALLSNAFDAVARAPERWVSLDCEAFGGDIVFAVSDSGPGVPRGMEERIMLPFFTTKAGGQGLGLSVSRGIADAHGGTLVLDTKRQYTRFVLRLPMHHISNVRANAS